MNFELVFKELLEKFEGQQIRYALIGGFALHVAGFTRATQDIDFLVHEGDVDKIKEIMSNMGYDLVHGSKELSNYWHPIGPLGGVDYLHAHREYTQQMLKRAKKHRILKNQEVPVVIPEDIIGLKVQSMANNPDRKSLDMADIEYLLREKLKDMNLDLIREYFELFERGEDLNLILKKVQNVE